MNRFNALIALLVASVMVIPSPAGAAAARQDGAGADKGASAIDPSGRWHLNPDSSDKPAHPGGEPGSGEGRWGGRRPGGAPPGGQPGGGRFPGGMGGMGGRPSGGGMRGGRGDPADMEKMRDAMRAALEAPPDLIVTHKDDELVFTAANSGDVTRLLVTGKKMKTTAGGAEHEVKAAYKDNALVVESSYGPMKVTDTWRVSADGRQLERLTKIEGAGRTDGGRERQIRRVYERVASGPGE